MSTTEKLQAMASAYILVKQNIEEHRRSLYNLEVEIKSEMEAMGATEVNLTNFKVKLESKTEYLKELLTPLLEYEEIPQRELDNARTPEKIIPPSWNMTKVKPLRKYSTRVANLIDSATVQSEPVLKIVG